MSVTQAVRNPRGYIVSTIGFYRALLFDPRRFYDEYLGSRGIKVEIVMLAVVGLVGFAGNYYARTRVDQVFTEAGIAIGHDVNFQLWRMALKPLVGIFALWIALAVALYAVGWLYSAVGQFYELLKRSAWALVPILGFNLIHSAAIAYSAFQLSVEDVEDLQLPRAPDQRVQEMWAQVGGEMVVVASILVGVIFVLWAGYIAAFAVLDVRDLDVDEAYKVAAVPTAAFAIYLVYDAATSLL